MKDLDKEETKDDKVSASNENPEQDLSKTQSGKKDEAVKPSSRKNTTSLRKVVTHWMGKDLCKFEQMSNWEARPLRQAQMHYAALDCFSEVWVFQKMAEVAQEIGYDIEKYNVEVLEVQ